MKVSDEYQCTECNHTGHAQFTALHITDIHIFPPFIQTNTVVTMVSLMRKRQHSRKVISTSDLILNPAEKKKVGKNHPRLLIEGDL